MPAQLAIWRYLDPDAQGALVQECIDALEAGKLIVFPTETVYGLAATKRGFESLKRAAPSWAGGPNKPAEPEFTWHAPSLERVKEIIPLPTSVHRRLVERLIPGPFRLVIQIPPERAEELADTHGDMIAADRDGVWIAVRIPEQPAAQALLKAIDEPVVARDLATASFTDQFAGQLGLDAIDEAAREAGVGAIVFDGPTRGISRSTTVRIARSGAFRVESAAPGAERVVLDALTRTVLFVCTGNTCRSPMAEAIARKILADRAEDGITFRVMSAGVAASDGRDASPEAVEAARMIGADVSTHRSQRVTPRLLAEAEVIYAMTSGHLASIRAIDPVAANRAVLLDPNSDVPDPIGGPLSSYIATAERLAELIAARMKELEP